MNKDFIEKKLKLDEVSQNIVSELKSNNQQTNLSNLLLTIIKDFKVYESYDNRKTRSKNPFNRFGRKCFSQSDEDGITLEIIKRLKIDKGYFAEFGVGNGLENNTLLLIALGWSGFWIGNENLACQAKNNSKFRYSKKWLTVENIMNLTLDNMKSLKIDALDVISLDMDGNDFYFCKKLLENSIHPKVFIVEYNAKFFPPIEFVIKYNDTNNWNLDDYFGASLQSFFNLFSEYEYNLVCCNSHTGSNAFFIKKEFKDLFPEIPNDINDIYMGPNYDLPFKFGHRSSEKSINNIFENNQLRY